MVKKSSSKNFIKPLIALLTFTLVIICAVSLTIKKNASADYIVETNAFFAPFEFYDNQEIVGVDVEIINNVAKKLNKTIKIKDVEFDVIIDNVAEGKIADAGAAGLTITPSRAEKVNFSTPYYTSVQYIIFAKNSAPSTRNGHVVWEALSGKVLGSQTGGTGYLFANDANMNIKGFDSHQLAADAISANMVDYAIADELVAQFIVNNNSNLSALPLYESGATVAEDSPVEESYAIAVNKNQPELLAAFNEVIAEMSAKDSDNKSAIDRLVLKYMGLENE